MVWTGCLGAIKRLAWRNGWQPPASREPCRYIGQLGHLNPFAQTILALPQCCTAATISSICQLSCMLKGTGVSFEVSCIYRM